MSHVPHPLAREARALYAISHMHTGTPLFQILDPPLHLAYIQWNPSIMNTLGTQNFVRYNEVSLSRGFRYIFGRRGMNRAVEQNVAAFSELSFAVRRQGMLRRG